MVYQKKPIELAINQLWAIELAEDKDDSNWRGRGHMNNNELIAAAATYEALNVWEKKQKKNDNEVHHANAKKLITGIVVKELVKLLTKRGDEDIKNNEHKSDLITNVTKSAAINYFDSKHSH